MSYSTVATDFHKTFDIEHDVTSQIAFDVQIVFDIVTYFNDLFFGQIFYTGVGIDARLGEQLL